MAAKELTEDKTFPFKNDLLLTGVVEILPIGKNISEKRIIVCVKKYCVNNAQTKRSFTRYFLPC